MAVKAKHPSNRQQRLRHLQQEGSGKAAPMLARHMTLAQAQTRSLVDNHQRAVSTLDHQHPRAAMASQVNSNNSNSLLMACPNNRNMVIQTRMLRLRSQPMDNRSMVRRRERTSLHSQVIPHTARQAFFNKVYKE